MRLVNCLKELPLQTKTLQLSKNEMTAVLNWVISCGLVCCYKLSIYLNSEKFRLLETDDVTETPILLTYKSVHEIAFELILRNVYIFELPLVEERTKIWFAIVKF